MAVAGLSRVAGLLASFGCNYLQATSHPLWGPLSKLQVLRLPDLQVEGPWHISCTAHEMI